MHIYKQKGFVSEHLNETLGTHKVEVRSRGKNNLGTSSIKIDGVTTLTATNNGIIVLLLNDDWSHYSTRRFPTVTDPTACDRLATYIRDIPDAKYVFMMSWERIATNDNLNNAMEEFGATRFLDIPFDRELDYATGIIRKYHQYTPYSAIGGSGVGIVYESIGTPNPDANFPDAFLSVYMSELEYLGCQGFGRNLAEFTHIGCGDCLDSDVSQFISLTTPEENAYNDIIALFYNK